MSVYTDEKLQHNVLKKRPACSTTHLVSNEENPNNMEQFRKFYVLDFNTETILISFLEHIQEIYEIYLGRARQKTRGAPLYCREPGHGPFSEYLRRPTRKGTPPPPPLLRPGEQTQRNATTTDRYHRRAPAAGLPTA